MNENQSAYSECWRLIPLEVNQNRFLFFLFSAIAKKKKLTPTIYVTYISTRIYVYSWMGLVVFHGTDLNEVVFD